MKWTIFHTVAPKEWVRIQKNMDPLPRKSKLLDPSPDPNPAGPEYEEGMSRTCEIPLYRLTRPVMVLSMSVCRVSMIVYIHKVSWLKLLLLNNSEIYNKWYCCFDPHFLPAGVSIVV
jgi:hypothetical protein